MAKKRKKDREEPEEYEFVPPEFNEKDFLKREIADIRTAIITVLYAIVIGIAAGAITLASDSFVVVAFLVGIAGMVMLKQLYGFLKIDTSKYQKKNWAGNFVSYFFTFLAIWVLVLNMPFSDHTNPSIKNAIVWVDDGSKVVGLEYKVVESTGAYTWVSMDSNYSVDDLIHARAGYTINITAKVSDNGKLSYVTISVGSGTPNPMTGEGKFRYGYRLTGDSVTPGTLIFKINAGDKAGNSYSFTPTTGLTVTA